jgi:hypothetical protein
MTGFRRAAAVALSLCLPGTAVAAERGTLAVGVASGPIRVDGVLDEPDWRSAPVAASFLLMTPREGEAPDESTTVRVLRDGDRLVIGIWCQAKRKPHASLTARDGALDGDHIAVHVDTDGDGQRAYVFGVNPYGVQVDGILTGDPDFKWDGVWDSATHRGDGEWTAEIAVPFRILRISAQGRPWRIWVRRELTAWNEVATWPLYRIGEPGPIMLQAADLDGLEGARGGRELSFEPYVFGARSDTRDLLESGGTTAWADAPQQEAGGDVQLGVTRSLVLNATYNPDFSQIEADALQIDVNRRFPLVFPEKRPFFLEGADHFLSLMELVLTRRMADPDWGTKLTGRAGGWNTGALVVRDAGGSSLLGSGYTPSNDSVFTRPGWYALERSQLPFGEGSNIGVLAGAHWMDAPEQSAGPGVADERQTFNGFGGFDSQVRLSGHWRTEAQVVGSSSYIDSVHTATARTSFADWMGVARLFYRDKARSLELGVRHVGEKFRDELGTQDFVGVTYRHVGAFWDLFPKGSALQRTAPIVDALIVHDHTGRLELADIQASQDFEFRRSAFVNAGYEHRDEHWLNRTYPQDRAHVFAQWTAWRPLTMDFDALVGDGVLFGQTDATSALAWQEVYVLNATARPTPRLSAAASATHYRLATAHDGDDYVRQWLVGVNLTAQFTQRLSVRVYPQYDSFAEHLDVNGLLSYVVHPGSVFYAGVNSGWDHDLASEVHRATSRQAFAKVSWRFFL